MSSESRDSIAQAQLGFPALLLHMAEEGRCIIRYDTTREPHSITLINCYRHEGATGPGARLLHTLFGADMRASEYTVQPHSLNPFVQDELKRGQLHDVSDGYLVKKSRLWPTLFLLCSVALLPALLWLTSSHEGLSMLVFLVGAIAITWGLVASSHTVPGLAATRKGEVRFAERAAHRQAAREAIPDVTASFAAVMVTDERAEWTHWVRAAPPDWLQWPGWSNESVARRKFYMRSLYAALQHACIRPPDTLPPSIS